MIDIVLCAGNKKTFHPTTGRKESLPRYHPHLRVSATRTLTIPVTEDNPGRVFPHGSSRANQTQLAISALSR